MMPPRGAHRAAARSSSSSSSSISRGSRRHGAAPRSRTVLGGSGLLLLLLLSLALCCAPLLPVVFAEDRTVIEAMNTQINIVASVFFTPLMSQLLIAYKLERPEINVMTSYGLSANIQPQLFNGLVDVAFLNSAAALTPAQAQANPDVMQLPFTSVGIAPIYKIQALQDAGIDETLVFSLPLLARIFGGNITHWRHPAILALQPLQEVRDALPDEKIQLVLAGRYAVTGQDMFCQVLTRLPPSTAGMEGFNFAAAYPCTPAKYVLPRPELTGGLRIINHTTSTDIVNAVATHANSLGFGPVDVSRDIGNSIGKLFVNGVTLEPTLASATLAVIEVGFPLVNGVADMTQAKGPYAWPLVQYTYIQINKALVRATCSQKAEVVDFLLWIYGATSSKAVSKVADEQLTPLIPSLVQTQLGILSSIREKITCLPLASAYTTSTQRSGLLYGTTLFSTLMPFLLAFYAQVDPAIRWTYLAGNRFAGYDLLDGPAVQGEDRGKGSLEIDALLTANLAADNDNDLLHVSLPFTSTATVFLYSAPLGLTLDQIGPVVLDFETAGDIFAGRISSWLDPRVARFNKRLTEALRADLLANPSSTAARLTTVLCCSNQRAVLPASITTVQTLSVTESLGSTPLINFPTNWALAWGSSSPNGQGSHWSMSDAENNIPRMVASRPGSIGYATVTQREANDALHVRLMPWVPPAARTPAQRNMLYPLDAEGFYLGNATRESISASIEYSGACIAGGPSLLGADGKSMYGGAFNFDRAYLDMRSASTPRYCWPMTVNLNVVIPRSYSDSAEEIQRHCGQGGRTLRLLSWLFAAPALGVAFGNLGLFRFTDLPGVGEYVQARLNRIECDGVPILVDVPLDYEGAEEIRTFARVYSGVWIALLGLILVLVARLRFTPPTSVVPATVSGGKDGAKSSSAAAAAAAVAASKGASAGTSSRSAHWTALMALGMILMFISSIVWVIPSPTRSSCSAFITLLFLGFDLAFFPQWLALWLASRIVARAAGAVAAGKSVSKALVSDRSKLTEPKKLLVMLLWVCADAIVLAVWLSDASYALQPGTTLAVDDESGRVYKYRSCILPVGSAGGTGFMASLVAIKVALVALASLMSFSIPKEGQGIGAEASMVVRNLFTATRRMQFGLYNMVFSVGIIIPLLAVLQPVGDTQTILVLIVIVWTCSFSACFIFGPLVWTAWKESAFIPGSNGGERSTASTGATEESLLRSGAGGGTSQAGGGNQGGGGGPAFSFLGVELLSRDALGRYILALDAHIVAAKKRLWVLSGHQGGGGGHGKHGDSAALYDDDDGPNGGGGGSEYSQSHDQREDSVSRTRDHSLSAPHHHASYHTRQPSGARGGGNSGGLSFRPGAGGSKVPHSAQASVVRENSIRLSSVTNNYMMSPTNGGRDGARNKQQSSSVAPNTGNAGASRAASSIPSSSRPSAHASPSPSSPVLTGAGAQASAASSGPVITHHTHDRDNQPAMRRPSSLGGGGAGSPDALLRQGRGSPMLAPSNTGGGGVVVIPALNVRSVPRPAQHKAKTSSGGGGAGSESARRMSALDAAKAAVVDAAPDGQQQPEIMITPPEASPSPPRD